MDVIPLKSILRKAPVAVSVVLMAASAVAQRQIGIQPGAADQAAAQAATRYNVHLDPTNTPASASLPKRSKSGGGNGNQTGPFQNGRPRAIGDVSYQGGSVVTAAQSHALYITNAAVNCTTPACWGDPEQFLQDLSGSDFIQITDQYTGNNKSNQYTVGAHAILNFPLPPRPLIDLDMLAIVHAVASVTHQTGYNHIYHLFLPPGTDECFDSTFSVCYSPDKLNTFFFCAYHESVTFSDIGHVLLTVEPFQNTPGCNLAPGSPNGELVDSTDSVLSHELFETITDPDGNAWWNTESNDLFGDEIADECSFIIFTPLGVFFDPPAFKIGGATYAVQAEYNNSVHTCTTTAHGN
jgi:hypothetical protein